MASVWLALSAAGPLAPLQHDGSASQQCGALLVVEKGASAVAAYDVKRRTVLWRAAVGEDPHEIAVDPSGHRAFISNYGGPGGQMHELSVIDLPDGKVLAPIDVLPLRSPHGLFVHDKSLWFTAETSKVIARLDLAQGRVDRVIGTGQDRSHMLAIAGDGTIAVANAASDSVSLIQRVDLVFAGTHRSDWKVTTIPVGAGTQGIAITPDGRSVWAMGAKDGSVVMIDTATRQVVRRVSIPWKAGNRLKLTPDGTMALIGSDALVAIDTHTLAVRTAPIGTTRAEGMEVSEDGRRVFVALPAENRIAIVALPSLRVEGYLDTGKTPDGMACLPWPTGVEKGR